MMMAGRMGDYCHGCLRDIEEYRITGGVEQPLEPVPGPDRGVRAQPKRSHRRDGMRTLVFGRRKPNIYPYPKE